MAQSDKVGKALKDLRLHHKASAHFDMRKAFAKNPRRFAEFSAHQDDLLLDYSKCAVTSKTMKLLLALAKAADVAKKRDAMFAGEIINTTESRAVLHTALRNQSASPVMVAGRDVMPEVRGVLAAMAKFAESVRASEITDVVNIGIGGSDLGPAMTTLALAPYHDGPRLHYVSNVDGAHIADTLKTLNPATTLFLIASKTFTTIETMTNARTARAWIVAELGEAAVAAHFAAISTALDKVAAFGISPERIFGFWDWVGGRYSIWSAIGLPLMIAIGPNNFKHFLDGAHAMDEHFRTADAAQEPAAPHGPHRRLAPQRLQASGPRRHPLRPAPVAPARLSAAARHGIERQAGDEIGGCRRRTHTGPLVWGEPGTNGQHAFFQLLHQGTDIIPVEFLIAAEAHEKGMDEHHTLLMANCLAQSEALMKGRTLAEATAQLLAMGKDKAEAKRLAPHRVFTGNRPSITLAYRKLDPYTLGRLIALYEHRVFVEAAIWDINAFDQWGVELGKELATGLQPVMEGKVSPDGLDGSTAGLVTYLRKLKTK